MFGRSMLVWLCVGSVAFAADALGDGCQDEFDANGACVAVSATVDVSSTVGANSVVADSVTVGPQVAIGANVVVAPRAVLAGRVAHTSNPLPIGTGTVIGRSAQLGADHVLGADVSIGRSVVAGARLTVATGASVGYAAQIGSDVTIGSDAAVGSLVGLGDYTTLGDDAVVARGTIVADSANAGAATSIGGIVGPEVTIAAGARIEFGARVRKNVDIGVGSAIEDGGRVGRGAVIESGATVFGLVGPNATVGSGATVQAGSKVSRGGEVCSGTTLPSGETVSNDGTWPVEGCTVTTSCLTIKTSDPSSTDGIYTIDPDGPGGLAEQSVYCDMTTDGGGWTLAASNHSGDTSFPGGTSRTNLFLHTTGYASNPSILADYLIGPAILVMPFAEARVHSDRTGNGSVVVDFKWNQSDSQAALTGNFSSTVLLAPHNVNTVGCGNANHCNLDGQWVDSLAGGFDSNANQRTIGAVCTQGSADPVSGTYVGHGATEGSYEGNYYIASGGCGAFDFDVYATFVR